MKQYRTHHRFGTRVGIFLLLAALCAALFSQPAAHAAFGTRNQLRTSHCEDNYFQFSIDGNWLTAEGVVTADGLTGLMIQCGERIYLDAASGVPFSVNLPLSGLSGPTSVDIYTSIGGSTTYWSTLWNRIYIEPVPGGYDFVKSPVLDNNMAFVNHWLNPGDYLGANIPNAVAKKSLAITEGVSDDYTKIFLLHKWVVENIYYDYDALNSGGITIYRSQDVLEQRRTVCEGYANLLMDLIRAQGIPCMKVSTYTLKGNSFALNTQYADAQKSNHTHVEAFVDGRWVTLDPTWDSGNTYENGTYTTKAPNGFYYFDITHAALAMDHKIITRGEIDDAYNAAITLNSNGVPINKNTVDGGSRPHTWAEDEVWSAISLGLVPYYLQGNYNKNITREDFCRLTVDLLLRYHQLDSVEQLLTHYGLTIRSDLFTDTNSPVIVAAYQLGIVNGRGGRLFDPYGDITRQEAAAMLTRTARALGISKDNVPRADLTDRNRAADWARESIDYVYRLQVMNGVGNGAFDPLGKYTREQSYMTIYRLFQAVQPVKEP